MPLVVAHLQVQSFVEKGTLTSKGFPTKLPPAAHICYNQPLGTTIRPPPRSGLLEPNGAPLLHRIDGASGNRVLQKGTSHVKPKRSILRAWPAFIVGLLILSLALFLVSDNQPSLSPRESRLVGEWSSPPHKYTRIFSPDRTFSTSDGQYFGVWRIDQGRLTVTYWTPFELPRSISIRSIGLAFNEIGKSRKRYIYTWEIEFFDNGRQYTLSHPVDELHPDGKWLWTRETDRKSQNGGNPRME